MNVLKFAPCGALVSIFNYLTFIIITYIDGDVFKVLQQSRLLGVALAARMWIGTKQGRTSWLALGMIVMCAVCFSQVKEMSYQQSTFQTILQQQHQVMKDAGHEKMVNFTQSAGTDGSEPTVRAMFDVRIPKGK